MPDHNLPTVMESAMRGIACKCPRCGKGKLYSGFLTLRPRCEACGLDYAFIDAGDGPAVFIIMIAGAIVVGCALIVEIKYQPPFWVHAALWLPLILVTPLPPPSQWSALTPNKDEFRRVSFSVIYQPAPDAMVYSSGSAVRDDISGPGTWAFMPARLPTGETVVINAGFVQNTMQNRAQQDRAVTRLVTGEPVLMTGYLRFPETAGVLTPKENLAGRL